MNYLFHNYYLVQSELPHLRKMHGKAPVDTPWKIPLPGHESSHGSQHQAHLEHQLHSAPQRQTGGAMFFPEEHFKAFEGHASATDGFGAEKSGEVQWQLSSRRTGRSAMEGCSL